eukprot:7246260-Alexandrium_andersonii.AAC.1
MTPNPPDEALQGGISSCFWPPRAPRIVDCARLEIAAGVGVRAMCRITDYSRTREEVYQARCGTRSI